MKTQRELDKFLKDLTRKRLAKNISENQLRLACIPTISRRDWWEWTRKLKKGEKRKFPNDYQSYRLRNTLQWIPKRKKLLKGRPGK